MGNAFSYARFTTLLQLGVCFLILHGCGRTQHGGPERVRINGTIRLNGELLPSGVIRLIPSEDSSLPESAVEILNGSYQTEQGVPVASYRVEITGTSTASGSSAAFDAPVDSKASAQIVPDKFNKNSTLEVTIEPSRSQYDFDLKE